MKPPKVDDCYDPITTTDMLRAQDLARIEELEALLREAQREVGQRSALQSMRGIETVYERIEAALKGKK